jgi:excisionase family DNA binding protein
LSGDAVNAAVAIQNQPEHVALTDARVANDEQADAVLDVEEVALLLRIGRNTVYELVGRNEIPHRRLGKQIRFSRAALMRWLDSWSSQGAKERQ